MGSPLPEPLNGLLTALLFLSACVGHVSLMVASHNKWYATPMSPRLSDVVQLFHGLLMLAGPLLFWYAYGFDLTTAFTSVDGEPAHLLGAAYLILCWLVSLVGMPIVVLRRRLRPRPVALLSNHTDIVDVKARLGYAPAGDGTYRVLSRLPGNQVFQVEFSVRTLRLPRLPTAWEGLSILHLSDLHLCGTPDRRFYQEVMDLCVEWEPDLIALSGDIVDTDVHRRWIVPLLGRLRWKIAAFAILGNHDLWYEPPLIRRRLRRAGFHVLGNGWTPLDIHGESLVVIGHEGPWFQPAPDLTNCPPDAFRLCLSHTPDNIRWAQQHGIDLMLSGHNHGGQIRFPVLGPLIVPSQYGGYYASGTFDEPPTLLHVSRGLGGEQPLRYNCRPEVTKLVLQKG